MSNKPFGIISCGTAGCESHNTNMPANCERSKKPTLSFCPKFTEEHPVEAKTMSDKPEKNGVFKTQSPCLCGSDGKFCGMTCNHQEKVVYCGLSRLPEQRCVNMAERADLAKPSEWISVDVQRPPNDYEWDCFILFKDGHKALSDGGTVCNDAAGQISHWMFKHEAVKYLPTTPTR